jgi:hypothetical protein
MSSSWVFLLSWGSKGDQTVTTRAQRPLGHCWLSGPLSGAGEQPRLLQAVIKRRASSVDWLPNVLHFVCLHAKPIFSHAIEKPRFFPISSTVGVYRGVWRVGRRKRWAQVHLAHLCDQPGRPGDGHLHRSHVLPQRRRFTEHVLALQLPSRCV